MNNKNLKTQLSYFRDNFSFSLREDEISSLLSTLCRSSYFIEWINAGLKNTVSQGSHKSMQKMKDSNFAVLLETEEYKLGLTLSSAKGDSSETLYNYYYDAIFCPIKIGVNQNYDMYRQTSGSTECSVFDSKAKYKLLKSEKLKVGKVIFVKKHIDILSVDNSTDLWCLSIIDNRDHNMFAWEFHHNNGIIRPQRIVLVDLNITRYITSIQILGDYGNISSLDTILHFINHKVHCVRWEAAKVLINLDLDLGVGILKNMSTKDPHPELRQAAVDSLEQISNIQHTH